MLVVLGLTIALVGLAAIGHGYWWIRGYNPRLGIIGTGSTLGFVFLGVLFMFIAFIPWRRVATRRKSKNHLYKTP